MSIVNPCSFYVNGTDQKSFTFEPGNKLYQVKIYGSRGWIPFSAMLMADSIDHVCAILRNLVEFRLQCDKEYCEYLELRRVQYPNHDEQFPYRRKMIEFTNHVGAWLCGNVDNLPEGFKVIIDEVNPNQLVKVSWASNDTLLD